MIGGWRCDVESPSTDVFSGAAFAVLTGEQPVILRFVPPGVLDLVPDRCISARLASDGEEL